MKGRTFHMTDLHNRKGDFEGIDDDEVSKIMVGTVRIIRRYASFAMAVACDGQLVADSLPTVAAKSPDMENVVAAFRSTYGFMCHFVMTALGTRANNGRSNAVRQISYVFERGDEGQGGLKRYLEYLGDEPHHRLLLDGYSYGRMTISDRDQIEGIFHAADLVAWEWARHVGRHKAGEPMRKSLSTLVGNFPAASDKFGITLSDGNRFFMRYFAPERISAVTAYFKDSLAATTIDEVGEALSRYREVCPAP